MIPLRFGTGNVDWQQRINWEKLRKDRVERAQQFMAKYGIGAALVYNHDRKRYLTGVWNHPYERAIPGTFILFIRGNGFPYVSVETHLDADRVKEDCPWLEGRLLNEHDLLQPRLTRYRTESLLRKQYSTCAGQVKALLKKHGVAELPVSVDYGSPGLIHALEGGGPENGGRQPLDR